MNEIEAARRVIDFLRTLDGFRERIEQINRDGYIAAFVDDIADAIKVQEIGAVWKD